VPVELEQFVPREKIGERVCGARGDRCVTTYYAAMGYGSVYRCEFPLGTNCEIDGGYDVGMAHCVIITQCSLSPSPDTGWPDADCSAAFSTACD
jgi:hypothetical protein